MTRNSSAIRILSLLRLLEGRRRWTLHDLAERFKVTTKTARRDISVLEEVGYPIAQECNGPGRGNRDEWWLL